MPVETRTPPPASPERARRKHRRRLERNPKARVLLGHSDRELLKLFRFFRIATLEQVQRLLTIQPRRMRQLYDAGYLARPRAQELMRQSRRGRAEDLYALGNKGATELRRLGLELPLSDFEQDAKELKQTFLEHALATSDVVTHFLVGFRGRSDLTLERVLRDGELRLSARYFDGRRELTLRGKPDTTLVVREASGKRIALFLEVDRGTAPHGRTDLLTQSSFLRKCRLYFGVWQEPALVRSLLGTEEFYVLTIAKTAADVAALRRIAATVDPEERGTHIFWFTTFAQLADDDPLSGELWTTAKTSTPGYFFEPQERV